MFFFLPGSEGVPDMTVISDIDEDGINKNLRARYSKDLIYVSFSKPFNTLLKLSFSVETSLYPLSGLRVSAPFYMF